MKFKHLLIGAIVLTSLQFCKEKKTTASQLEVVTEKKVKVDSLRILDSLKVTNNLTLLFDKKLLVFETLNNKTLLDSIYDPTYIVPVSFSKTDVLSALEKEKENFFVVDSKSDFDYIEFQQKWDETSNMDVFSEVSDYTTIKYISSGYSGGAHGYYNEIYKVFDFQNNKTIQLQDVVKNENDPNWNNLLMSNFEANNTDALQMLLVKNIPLNSNFYFDKDKITFVYNQYEITAYAAGVQYITFEIDEIKKHLKDDFLASIK